jgi:hypothetical protein
MGYRFLLLPAVAFLMAGASGTATAQGPATAGIVTIYPLVGTIQAPDGARLPGVVSASLDGVRTRAMDVEATAGARLVLDITLEIEAQVETVTVVGRSDRESLEVPRIRESAARDAGEALAGLAGVWNVRRGAEETDREKTDE